MRGIKNTGTTNRQSKAFRETILERDGYRCRLCGCAVDEVCDLHYAPVRQLDVAHIIPWAISHDTTPANLRATCHPCNKREAHGTQGQPVFSQ